jgi:hypothetical protein
LCSIYKIVLFIIILKVKLTFITLIIPHIINSRHPSDINLRFILKKVSFSHYIIRLTFLFMVLLDMSVTCQEFEGIDEQNRVEFKRSEIK